MIEKDSGEPVRVRKAGPEDLESILPLFDAYRQFYGQPPDPELARGFLRARFQHNESIIFLALDSAGRPLGFTQLYPSFSSAAAKSIYILNDLFVVVESRRRGVGRLLLEAAAEFGRQSGAARLILSTALDNLAAQAAYEKSGWQRDKVFCTYTLTL